MNQSFIMLHNMDQENQKKNNEKKGNFSFILHMLLARLP